MSDELKPCPFCGVSPKEEWHQYRNGTLQVYCDNPECPAESIYTGLLEPSEARKAWNTRPVEDALRAEIERWRADATRLAAELKLEQNPGCTCDALREHYALIFPSGSEMDAYTEFTDRMANNPDDDLNIANEG